MVKEIALPDPFRDFAWAGHDNLPLHARIYDGPVAAAPTVLCLHGLMRNCRDFEELAPHLQKNYRVIVPDLRGRGLSARDPTMQNYQPGIYLKDLLALLAAIGAARVAVVGTSLGGILAMMLGHAAPSLIAGIVLNDIGPEIDASGVERIKGYAGRTPPVRDWDEARLQAETVYGDAWPDLSSERWAILTRRGYREDGSGRPRVDADPLIGEAMRTAPGAPQGLWPAWKALRDLPTLAIRGAHSDILSAGIFARMKAEMPKLLQLSVRNRGHPPLLDEPECVMAIDGFLSTLHP
jgi:pimeloyl-ACP methyl ester carboxylesterase